MAVSLFLILCICSCGLALPEADPAAEPHVLQPWDGHLDHRYSHEEHSEFRPSLYDGPSFEPFDDHMPNRRHQTPNIPHTSFGPNRRRPGKPQRLSGPGGIHRKRPGNPQRFTGNQDMFSGASIFPDYALQLQENFQNHPGNPGTHSPDIFTRYLASLGSMRPTNQEQNRQHQAHPLAHLRPAPENARPVSESIRHGATEGLPLFGNIPIVGVLLLQPQVPTRDTLPWWSMGDSRFGQQVPSSLPPTRGYGFIPRGAACSNNKETGTCYPRSECKGKGGRPINYCRDFSQFCCLFHLSCGDESEEEISYFRNTGYPLHTKLHGECALTVRKRGSEYCGVRIEATALDLPANIGYCEDASVDLIVTGRKFESLCGDLTGRSFDVSMVGVDTIIVKFQTSQKMKLEWNLAITQILCSAEALSTTWPAVGAGSFPDVAPPPADVSHTPRPIIDFHPTEIASKAGNLKCGVSNARENSQNPPEFTDPEFANDEVSLNPLLTSFEWSVPVLKESNLYKNSGVPQLTNPRITYGSKASPYEYPWQIAMYSKGRFHCGASLISDRHVLTAGHCIRRYQYTPHHLTLAIGDYDVSNTLDGETVTRKVSKISVHPGYSTATLKYDVGVVTLDRPVTLNRQVSPVCLPPYDIPLEGTVPTVTGWGRDERNRLQKVLMELSASVINNAECDKRWVEKGAHAGIITNTMMCMDPQYGDSCKGDSGGPSVLEYPAGSGTFIQVGIVSFGSATCTDKRLPGVYTRVGLLSDWIRQQMN